MARTQHDETGRKALAWLERFAREWDADPDIIDSMPIEEIQAELRDMGADVEGFHATLAKTLSASQFRYGRSDLQELLADELYWEPQYAGQLVAAADIPKQEHSFQTEYGEIRVACSWGEQHQDDPAYIWLSWKANVSTDKDVRIRFVNPETRKTYHEINLGTIRVGEETFTRHELGFDPSTERWAVVAVI